MENSTTVKVSIDMIALEKVLRKLATKVYQKNLDTLTPQELQDLIGRKISIMEFIHTVE
jgi:hypothetical protein